MKQTNVIGIKIFLFIAAVLLLAALIFYPQNLTPIIEAAGAVAIPLLLGLFIAFIFDKPINLLERLFPFKNKLLCRVMASVLFFLTLGVIIWLLYEPIISSLTDSFTLLSERLPSHIDRFFSDINGFTRRLGIETDINAGTIIGVNNSSELIGELFSSAISGITAFSITLVSAAYMLICKRSLIKQVDKLCYALFTNKVYFFLQRVALEMNRVFSGYFAGKLLQCLIVGILTFIPMQILGLPYAVLISVIMAVTNIVSMIGPVIGAVPSAVLLYMESTSDAVIFVIITVAVQFLVGQLLAPKMFSGSIGVPPFWVLFALVAGGAAGGVMGMIIGVPVFSIFYILLKEFIDLRIYKKDHGEFESDEEKIYNMWENNQNGG